MKEVVQIIVYENESSLRKIDLVESELAQVKQNTSIMRSKLDQATISNEALHQILLGIETTDTDKSIAYLSKYVDH